MDSDNDLSDAIRLRQTKYKATLPVSCNPLNNDQQDRYRTAEDMLHLAIHNDVAGKAQSPPKHESRNGVEAP